MVSLSPPADPWPPQTACPEPALSHCLRQTFAHATGNKRQTSFFIPHCPFSAFLIKNILPFYDFGHPSSNSAITSLKGRPSLIFFLLWSPSLDVCLTASCRRICQLKQSFSYDAKLNSKGSTLPRHVLSAWCDVMPDINEGILTEKAGRQCNGHGGIRDRKASRQMLTESKTMRTERPKWADDGANINFLFHTSHFHHCILAEMYFSPHPLTG